MNTYHAIIIENSLTDPDSIKQFDVLSTIKDGSWSISKIEIDEDKLTDTVEQIQESLVSDRPWYSHAYDEMGNKLIVIFKSRVFTTNSNKTNWEDVIEYGMSLGIPREQLDFKPCNFKDETY